MQSRERIGMFRGVVAICVAVLIVWGMVMVVIWAMVGLSPVITLASAVLIPFIVMAVVGARAGLMLRGRMRFGTGRCKHCGYELLVCRTCGWCGAN
jgi:hypothetical protein